MSKLKTILAIGIGGLTLLGCEGREAPIREDYMKNYGTIYIAGECNLHDLNGDGKVDIVERRDGGNLYPIFYDENVKAAKDHARGLNAKVLTPQEIDILSEITRLQNEFKFEKDSTKYAQKYANQN